MVELSFSGSRKDVVGDGDVLRQCILSIVSRSRRYVYTVVREVD